MAEERKIAIVGRTLSFVEAEEEDDRFWAKASVEERLAETYRLRREHYTQLLGVYPEKIALVVTKRQVKEG